VLYLVKDDNVLVPSTISTPSENGRLERAAHVHQTLLQNR
jgi:hypothetical protein